MTQKIPCPKCGEINYESSPACWKCGAAMKPKPSAPPPEPPPLPQEAPPPLAPELPEAPAPPDSPEPPLPSPTSAEAPDPAPQPSASSPQPSPKPAELEAASLKEKEFVTPPVDVEEKPTSPSEWLDYVWAAIASSGSSFKEALNDYDTRRGRKSGGISSYGCVLAILACTVLAVLAGVFVSFLTHNPTR